MRLRWLVVRFGMPVAAGDDSEMTFGLLASAILIPRPTSCVVLGELASDCGGEGPGAFLSDVQYLTRCTELSKLLFHRKTKNKKET